MASVIVAGDVSGSCTLQAPSAAGSTVLTLPVIAADTLAGIAATQTLTNKTLVAPALGTPASGVLTNCTGVPASALPAGSVLQVVSTTLTTDFTASVNNSYSAVTGLTAAITPRSASNKIYALVTMTVGSDTNYVNAKLTLGGTAISGALATAAGSRTVGTSAAWPAQLYGTYSMAFNYLDSPATTSSVTYGIQIGNANAATLYVNRSSSDDNTVTRTRGTSTITVMEIQG